MQEQSTKQHFDEQGDLIVKMRKLDGHLAFIEDLLKARAVLSEADVARGRAEYQIFPSVA